MSFSSSRGYGVIRNQVASPHKRFPVGVTICLLVIFLGANNCSRCCPPCPPEERPAKTVIFSGKVLSIKGEPIAGAEVEVKGVRAKAGKSGAFKLEVPKDQDTPTSRYVVNARMFGYGLYSQIFSTGFKDFRIVLTKGTIATFNPQTAITLTDDRDPDVCKGPEGPGGPGGGPDPNYPVIYKAGVLVNRDLTPQERALFDFMNKDKPCSRGITITIPPNSLVVGQNNIPDGQNVQVAVSTVDLYRAGSLPGDFSVRGERPSFMQSFGAGTVDIQMNGKPLQLRKGARAIITIPVDPTILKGGGKIDPEIPILLYDESDGVWDRRGMAKYNEKQQAYVGEVDHLSTVNMDTVWTNQTCIRIDSSGTGMDYTPPGRYGIYWLKVSFKYQGIDVVKFKPVGDNNKWTLHALINLPPEPDIEEGGLVGIQVYENQDDLNAKYTKDVIIGPTQDPPDNPPEWAYDACPVDCCLANTPPADPNLEVTLANSKDFTLDWQFAWPYCLRGLGSDPPPGEPNISHGFSLLHNSPSDPPGVFTEIAFIDPVVDDPAFIYTHTMEDPTIGQHNFKVVPHYNPCHGEGGIESNVASETIVGEAVFTVERDENIDDNRVDPNEVITYKITITNTGNVPNPTALDLVDTVDEDLENITPPTVSAGCGGITTADCNVVYGPPNTMTCPNITVQPFQGVEANKCVIEFTAKVISTTPAGSDILNSLTFNGVTYPGPDLVVNPVPILSIFDKQQIPAAANPGDVITYTIIIENTGNAAAAGVIVEDQLDSDLIWPPDFGSFTDCGESDLSDPPQHILLSPDKYRFQNLKIANDPAAKCTIVFHARIKAATPPSPTADIINTADLYSADMTHIDSITTGPVTVNSFADLSTAKSTVPPDISSANPNDTIEYKITLRNAGNAPTPAAQTVYDNKDARLTNYRLQTSPDDFSGCGTSFTPAADFTNDPSQFSGLEVLNGTDCVIRYLADVITGAPAGEWISNDGYVNSTGNLPFSSQPVQVNPVIDLHLTRAQGTTEGGQELMVPSPSARPGEEIFFHIYIENTGNADAEDVIATEVIDADLVWPPVFVGFTNCGSDPDDPPRHIQVEAENKYRFENLTVAKQNASALCTIVYKAAIKPKTLDTQSISNSVSLEAPYSAVSPAVITPAIAVQTWVDVSVSKVETDPDDRVDPKQTVTYEITLVNNGSATGSGVEVIDEIDSKFRDDDLNNTFSIAYSPECVATAPQPEDPGVYTAAVDPDPAKMTFSGLTAPVANDCVITLTATVKDAATVNETIKNKVSVNPATVDNTPGDFFAQELIVNPYPILGVTMSFERYPGSSTYYPTEEVVFTIEITNTGNAEATGVSATTNMNANLGNFIWDAGLFSGCGTSPDPAHTGVSSFSNIRVQNTSPGNVCTITFTGTVADPGSPYSSYDMTDNNVTITGMASNGEYPTGAVSAPTITVGIPVFLTVTNNLTDTLTNKIVEVYIYGATAGSCAWTGLGENRIKEVIDARLDGSIKKKIVMNEQVGDCCAYIQIGTSIVPLVKTKANVPTNFTCPGIAAGDTLKRKKFYITDCDVDSTLLIDCKQPPNIGVPEVDMWETGCCPDPYP